MSMAATAQLAYDDTLDWLHCNNCFCRHPLATLKPSLDSSPFYFTACGHTICTPCTSQNANNQFVCPVCKDAVDVVVLENEIPESLRIYFVPSLTQLDEALLVQRFQHSQSTKLIRHLAAQVDRQKSVLERAKSELVEFKKCKEQLHHVQGENQKLKSHLASLQNQLASIQPGIPTHSRPTSRNVTPTRLSLERPLSRSGSSSASLGHSRGFVQPQPHPAFSSPVPLGPPQSKSTYFNAAVPHQAIHLRSTTRPFTSQGSQPRQTSRGRPTTSLSPNSRQGYPAPPLSNTRPIPAGRVSWQEYQYQNAASASSASRPSTTGGNGRFNNAGR